MSDALTSFTQHIENLKAEIEKFKSDLLEEPITKDLPQLDPNDDIDALLHCKLKLESEIESVMNSSLQLLPKDNDILLNLAKEQSQCCLLETNQTLALQKEYNKNLESEIKNLKHLIKNAELVESNLDDLSEEKTEVYYAASLKYRHAMFGTLFQELREELMWFLNTRFPPPRNDLTISLEDILEALTKQFLKEPNNPYVQFTDDVCQELELLCKGNVVAKHPSDFSKYKLVDFRE